MTDIAFRRMTDADLPLMRDWLTRPHICEWWGEGEDEIAHIADMIAGRDTTEPYVFLIDGAPLGYIQVWHIKDQKTPDVLAMAPWVALLADDAVGVDVLISDPDRLSAGIGSSVIRAFVAGLRERGFATIIIDPDPANKRAVRAYEKAGFRIMPELLGKTDDSLLMLHHPDLAARTS
jgi:RimJ/RimL family protein N-acetyltransferase